MSDQQNDASAKRFSMLHGIGSEMIDPKGGWVLYRDYEALLKERDAAQKYAALCRVQFEKGGMAADAFQKRVMALEKERDELKADLEKLNDELDSTRDRLNSALYP